MIECSNPVHIRLEQETGWIDGIPGGAPYHAWIEREV